MHTNHKKVSATLKDTYLSNELQHGLDTLHHSLCFTADQHHPVCRLRTTLLKQLDAGLCVLQRHRYSHTLGSQKKPQHYTALCYGYFNIIQICKVIKYTRKKNKETND